VPRPEAALRSLSRTDLVLVGAGGLGFLTLVLSGFVGGGYDRWEWASAPLFVYAALIGLLATVVLALLARLLGQVRPPPWLGPSWGMVHLALGTFSLVNAACVLVVGNGSVSGALVTIICAGLIVVCGIDLQRGARSPRA
jgi:hypothetical protein